MRINWIYRVVAGAFILGLILLSGFWFNIKSFGDSPLPVTEGSVFSFTVEPGMGLIRVANQLEDDGRLESARSFRWLARFFGESDQIKTGEYEITAGLTNNALLDNMIAGRVKQYPLTIVEGWNFKQMMVAIRAHEKLKHTLEGDDPDYVMTALGKSGMHPEGRFLPDTYLFPLGTTDLDFLRRAYYAMEKELAQQWAQRDADLPYEGDPYKALTMASIVEKETAVPDERHQIAGVFVRRLHKRMRLQTDPTVIYGMGDRYQGNIRKRDLLRDTPYNSYTRRGLPPTPIAMPGKDAIHAALHPAEGDELFFVAKGDGSHYFSSTNEEHIRAVRKYQIKKRRKDYRSTPTSSEN